MRIYNIDIKQLIEGLIKDLYENKSLSDTFLKLQIIIHLLKNEQLTKWFNNENDGYKDNDNLPDYRILPASLEATIIQGSLYYAKFHLPTDIIEEKMITYLNKIKIYDSVHNFSNIISNNGNGVFCKPLQLYTSKFCKLQKNCHIEKIWLETQGNYLEEMISKIKSKLLQFLLEINENLDLNVSFTDMENKEKIEKAFNQTINITQHISDGNNNITIGKNVEQNVNQNGIDYEKLKECGVEEQHIIELKTIEKETDKNKLKEKVLDWIGKVSVTVAAKGLYDNIPAITDFVKRLM